MTNRTERFRRNPELERLLGELNDLLEPAERSMRGRYRRPDKPVVLVIGAPRSGTTLMMQWLAQSGQFAYPTNLLSRFFRAPYIGALINQLIGNPQYNYGDELWNHSVTDDSYRSNLGKTSGMFEPNEFWYFWRRFIPNDQAVKLTAAELASIDVGGFCAGIACLQAVFGKAWAMKGIILQYDLEFLNSIFDSVLFIHTNRDLIDNAGSLLRARENYFGDTRAWFSVRPDGYEKLLERSPAEQVVGQVAWTNRSISRQLQTFDPSRFLQVDYLQFCESPRAVYDQIRTRLAAQRHEIEPRYAGPERFDPQGLVDEAQRIVIREAIDSLDSDFPSMIT